MNQYYLRAAPGPAPAGPGSPVLAELGPLGSATCEIDELEVFGGSSVYVCERVCVLSGAPVCNTFMYRCRETIKMLHAVFDLLDQTLLSISLINFRAFFLLEVVVTMSLIRSERSPMNLAQDDPCLGFQEADEPGGAVGWMRHVPQGCPPPHPLLPAPLLPCSFIQYKPS